MCWKNPGMRFLKMRDSVVIEVDMDKEIVKKW